MEDEIRNQPSRYDIPIPEESPNRDRITGNFDKLNVYNWYYKKPSSPLVRDIVEVKFKNTRKGFYQNINGINLNIGDIVAVEGNPGHDIGKVSLVGESIFEQLKCHKILLNSEFKKVFRKAKPADIEKWKEAIALEHETMLEARRIARSMELDMKIGDVEYQGDKTKAIFYYIADQRVDFRQLIKVLADRFKVRVEMRQIGARQEAGRIGGIGSCGRELCCSTWINNFVSVATVSARYQELSLNPQKLAGQCSKLKCCLNYEIDSYLDARKDMPPTDIVLKTKEGDALHQKTDVYKRHLWYSIQDSTKNQLVALTPERVRQITELNRKGIIPDKLLEKDTTNTPKAEDNDNIQKNQPKEVPSQQETRSKTQTHGNKNKFHRNQKNFSRNNGKKGNDGPKQSK